MKWYFFAWLSASCAKFLHDKRLFMVKKYDFLGFFENIVKAWRRAAGRCFARYANGGVTSILRVHHRHLIAEQEKYAGVAGLCFTMHTFLLRLIFMFCDFMVIIFHRKRFLMVNNCYISSKFIYFLSFHCRTKD